MQPNCSQRIVPGFVLAGAVRDLSKRASAGFRQRRPADVLVNLTKCLSKSLIALRRLISSPSRRLRLPVPKPPDDDPKQAANAAITTAAMVTSRFALATFHRERYAPHCTKAHLTQAADYGPFPGRNRDGVAAARRTPTGIAPTREPRDGR